MAVSLLTRRAVALSVVGLVLFLVLRSHSSSLSESLPGTVSWDKLSSLASDRWSDRWTVDRDPAAGILDDDEETDGTGRSSYRQHLDETTSPAHFRHSRTLTFDAIYVLSLPAREDRRSTIIKLAKALDIDVQFVDAVDKHSSVIGWIGERVAETRKRKKDLLIKARKGSSGMRLGGSGIASPWLDGVEGHKYPSLKDERWGGKDWLAYLHDPDTEAYNLRPSAGFDIEKALFDPVEKSPNRQINAGVISTWFSHDRILRQMAANGDKSALILEDDVDAEWELERMWASAYRRMPKDWDTAFLGHCWGREMEKPAYLHPKLHRSTAPRCLHGYAVSKAGNEKIMARLNDPWIAFQGAIDNLMPNLITHRVLNSFSHEPPLIIQRKELASDIQPGIGSKWRGVLTDSTMERIRLDEGEYIDEPYYDPKHLDPALVYRPRPCPVVPPAPVDKAAAKKEKEAQKEKAGGPERVPKVDPPTRPKIDFAAGLKKDEEIGSDKPEDAPLAAAPKLADDNAAFHPVVEDTPEPPPPDPKPVKPFKVGSGGKVHAPEPGELKEPPLPVDEDEELEVEDLAPLAKEAALRVGTGARPGAQGLAGGVGAADQQ
ncbi:hypothetical protein MNV49_001551 [Pseudohyphozyma bogoriensis]|nr:hypothetical protein MNV49_001551 [Pseudohyphozyma bogoriensis]